MLPSRFQSYTTNYTYQQILVQVDEQLGAAYLYMKPKPRPCFTPTILEDIRTFQETIARYVRSEIDQNGQSSIRYFVSASSVPGIYNLGGDLDLFANLIAEKNRGGLLDYAITSTRLAYNNSVSFGVPITTIALIQGTAQGGGFEAALAHDVIIAERGTRMGFPEVLFNLFPGMGAYNFLSKRIAPAMAERLILSGKLYEAEELYELGLVDVVANPGEGHDKLRTYIRESDRRAHSRKLIRYARAKYNHVTYEEMLDIADLWVESALNLKDNEVKTMKRLVNAQDRQIRKAANKHKEEQV